MTLPVSKAARRDLRTAWIGILLVPIGFAVAMLLGETTIGLLGYPAGGDEVAPAWMAGMVGTAVSLVGISPGAGAVIYGMRAKRKGLPRGLIPAIIGSLAALYWVFTTVTGLAGLT